MLPSGSLQNDSVTIMEKESSVEDGQSSCPRSVPGPGRWSTSSERRAGVARHHSRSGRGHVPVLPRLAPRRIVTVSALATVAFRLPACLSMKATETAGTSPPCTVDVRQRVNATSFRHRSRLGCRTASQVSVSIRRVPPSPEPRATRIPQANHRHAIRRSTTKWNAGSRNK